MKWLMVWNSITSNPKWLALPIYLRGAWITLMCYASTFEPERWRFRDRQHAALLLRRDGAADADDAVEGLVAAGWLDDAADGSLEIHDHGDWQRYPSDMPDQSAERKRQSRSRAVTTGHERVPTRGEEKKEKKGSTTRSGGGPAPVVDVLAALTDSGLDPELAATFASRRSRTSP